MSSSNDYSHPGTDQGLHIVFRYCRHQVACILLLVAGLTLIFLSYRPGLGSDFHFDDRPSISGLQQVTGTRSAIEFVLSGQAGPLGRPIALTSFLINRPAWPDDPSSFLYTNVLIHLINGLLVAWLVLRLCRSREEPVDRSGYVAVAAAGIWMALPILASTSLLVVQRMTSLSATFVLLGLLGYLLCRGWIERRPSQGLAGMSASLALFTLLAVLTKENGALLPVFVLVMEATLLGKPSRLSSRTWRVWRCFFLWLPALAIAAALATMVPYSDVTTAMRGFSAWERLLTQAGILWEYLFHAFVPADTTQLGPFTDTYQPARSILEPLTFLAVTGWLAVIGMAWHYRHSFPVFSFAVFWYLTGHLVESTVVPLELYFEHRNYLPLVGPAFAIAWGVVSAPRRYRKAAVTGMAAYLCLLAVTLWLVASQWGHPFREAQERYAANPESPRAVGYFSAHLLGMGLVKPATAVLDSAIERNVTPNLLRVTKLYLSCRHGREVVTGEDLPRLLDSIREARFNPNLAHAVYVLTRDRVDNECQSISLRDTRRLIEGVAANPLYRYHGESQYWLHRARAKFAAGRGNRQERKNQLFLAQEARFDPFALKQWITLQAEDGQLQEACARLRQLREEAPYNPVKGLHRYLKLEALASELSQQMPGKTCQI